MKTRKLLIDMESRIMKTKYSNETGFTLIEVLIAAVLLVYGLLAMASFLGNMVSQNASNERKTMASMIAEDKIEELRMDALTLDITSTDNGTDTVNTAAGTFTRTWTITEDFRDLSDQIEVEVDWDGVGNSQLTMVTLINN